MKENNKQRNKVGIRKIAPPNYLIVCEGKETEPNYFNGLKQKINEKYRDKINVVIPDIKVKGTGLNTEDLVNYTKRYINHSSKMYGQVWIVFDKDDYSDKQFNNAIKTNEYKSAWSNPNFEIWILSHFKLVTNRITKNETLEKVKKEFKNNDLGEYKKNDKDIFKKLNLNGKLDKAIKNCKKMYENLQEISNKSDKNPSTLVFMLVEELKDYII